MHENLIILEELSKHQIDITLVENLTKITEKDGIFVYRFTFEKIHCVIKYFELEKDRREIFYYKLLKVINVPTIKVYSMSLTSIILEDIKLSSKYRLGKIEDLSNSKIAIGIYNWYKILHQNSRIYLNTHQEVLSELYCEYDLLSKNNVEEIIDKTNSAKYEYWNLLLSQFDNIKKQVDKLSQTLTYNDFYYTNFIVSNDETEVIMFDYNLLGKGFVYSDIRNVFSSLNEPAKDIFLKAYKEYNVIEKYIDDVLSPLLGLHMAFSKEKFPKWAEEDLRKIENGELALKIKLLSEEIIKMG